ncbi:MAG: glycosyltransferase family 4 protein [Rikenellaceae bacterium]|nr:glycosyltransferase family 4 protein [Rikenellaceae bacterium]MDE7356189.1 glycosyltransferase family 4 protein [Rikenellaceae bacterium]
MKILTIGPLPPPLHGQSAADRMAFDGLASTERVTVIDSAIDKAFAGNKMPPLWSPARLVEIVRILFRDFAPVWLRGYDVVYMSVGSSFRTLMRFLPYMIAARVKGEPYVLHIHSARLYHNYASLSGFKRRLMGWCLKGAASVVVLGDTIARTVGRILPPQRIRVCANGIDDTLRLSDDEFGATLDSSGADILFLSNLMEAKGIFQMLDAFELLADSYRLTLAGAIESDAVRQRVERMCDRYPGRVVYRGVVTGRDKRDVLKNSDILVLPSHDEGQGIVILESYATGCAVVTDPSVGGIGDIFADGVNGVACDHADPRSIAASIAKVGQRLSFYKEVNRMASESYSEAAFLSRVKSILEDSVAARG